MSTAAEKANLARIRDNQRRSRARRKEYLQELETRVRQCELQGIEASTEIQVAARRVADENRKLRLLLNQTGIFDDMIEHHLVNTVLPDSNGAGGQAVALLEELLQPRKPAGGASFLSAVEYGRGVSRDSSVGSMSTSQSSIWDQPMGSVHSSSGHKRHRSAHSHNPLHSSTSLNASGSATPNSGIPQSNSRNNINQGASMATQNQGQQHIQSSTSISPANTSMTPSPVYNPKAFEFDSQAKNSYDDSNNFYFQPPSLNSLQSDFNHFIQPQPPPNSIIQPVDQNLQSQSQYHSHSRSNSQNSNPPNANPCEPNQTPNSDFESTLMNSSSCIFATDLIRTMTGGREEDVRAELGCGVGGEDCDVRDEIVFEVMDRYS